MNNTTYDIQLQTALNHLVIHPKILPFFGNSWEKQQHRILFVAESHYLPKESDNKSCSKTWYENKSSFLTDKDRDWIHTRGIVTAADNYALGKSDFSKGHTIFYNIKAAIFEALQIKITDQKLFQHFGYYNYFQRPAETIGGSINNSRSDNRIAYFTLKAIAENAGPTVIIFVSKKAYNSFCYWRKKQNDGTFKGIIIRNVPHPASAWWNKKSKAYSDTKAITGKEKFISIIKGLNLQLELITNT